MDIPEKEFNDQWNEEAANEKMTPKPLGLHGGVVRGDPSVSTVALCVCVCEERSMVMVRDILSL